MNEKARGQGLLSVEQALEALLTRAERIVDREEVALDEALGRVLAHGLASPQNVPPHDNSAMDGYAVRCADLAGGALRVGQRIPAGSQGVPLEPGTCARIFTGAPIPPGADAVVMQEHCRVAGDQVTVEQPASPGQHVRRAGEDITAGAEILAAGTRLRPQELGLAASVGLARLPVVRRPRVALFSTGDELVAPGEALGPGQIYNSNRYTLAGLLRNLGCEVLDLGAVEDTLEATREVLRRAAGACDLILTSGGVSVGEEDHVKAAVESLGALELWRIAVKPGKPLAFGSVDGTPFMGLPGNPVSSFATFCLFTRPFLLRRLGVQAVMPRVIPAESGFDWTRPGDRREYLRARLEPDAAGRTVVTLYPNQGSGVLTSTSWAEGFVIAPEGQVIRRGDPVSYIPFAELLS
ncbi:gephyrin-like molybdotransferase Glp [Thioalbus denitrificans]|uniref:Molybdopterin molybdenumtransferase n=1 Tax=Thioalbus denitrificans TaxID=547122 RepID=A0A369CAF1_9GAMM|nr:gephyrin-like molybdotransferase Glp [Thioalbus denitrificans]RCX30703.1 molybdopterin molybdotransferase [Thioalbus denitrificans]